MGHCEIIKARSLADVDGELLQTALQIAVPQSEQAALATRPLGNLSHLPRCFLFFLSVVPLGARVTRKASYCGAR